MNFAGLLAILDVVRLSLILEDKAEFTDTGAGILLRFISWKTSTFGGSNRIKRHAFDKLGNQLTVSNSGGF